MAYVRCVAKQVVMHSGARNRLLCECSGISELVIWLDSLDRRPGLDELESKLISMEVNIPVLKECIGYAEDGYQRNVIKKTEHYELVAICWTTGQLTPIHDHVGSDCAFKIIDGVSTCLLYTSPSPRDQRGSRMPACG